MSISLMQLIQFLNRRLLNEQAPVAVGSVVPAPSGHAPGVQRAKPPKGGKKDEEEYGVDKPEPRDPSRDERDPRAQLAGWAVGIAAQRYGAGGKYWGPFADEIAAESVDAALKDARAFADDIPTEEKTLVHSDVECAAEFKDYLHRRVLEAALRDALGLRPARCAFDGYAAAVWVLWFGRGGLKLAFLKPNR